MPALSEPVFALLSWGSVVLVLLVFAYVLVTVLRDLGDDPEKPQPGRGRQR